MTKNTSRQQIVIAEYLFKLHISLPPLSFPPRRKSLIGGDYLTFLSQPPVLHWPVGHVWCPGGHRYTQGPRVWECPSPGERRILDNCEAAHQFSVLLFISFIKWRVLKEWLRIANCYWQINSAQKSMDVILLHCK